VQGNVPLRDKWDATQRDAVLERYRQLSVDAPPSRLIVWPEAAIPTLLNRIDPAYLKSLRDFARDRGTDFLIGVLEYDAERREFYNSAAVIGANEGTYRKRHLVPFGEYVPLKPLFRWMMNSLQIPMSDLTPASSPQTPLTVAGRRIGVSVCYEDAFGEEIARALPQAAFLVNVSEDAWFGDSLAPHQRLQMARLRALETGRPMLRATNTGPSVVIDDRGRVSARAPQFQAYVLHTEVQPMRGSTIYVTLGDWLAVALALLLIAFANGVVPTPRFKVSRRA
jgi:apolipoprotein N-acyltransferase